MESFQTGIFWKNRVIYFEISCFLLILCLQIHFVSLQVAGCDCTPSARNYSFENGDGPDDGWKVEFRNSSLPHPGHYIRVRRRGTATLVIPDVTVCPFTSCLTFSHYVTSQADITVTIATSSSNQETTVLFVTQTQGIIEVQWQTVSVRLTQTGNNTIRFHANRPRRRDEVGLDDIIIAPGQCSGQTKLDVLGTTVTPILSPSCIAALPTSNNFVPTPEAQIQATWTREQESVTPSVSIESASIIKTAHLSDNGTVTILPSEAFAYVPIPLIDATAWSDKDLTSKLTHPERKPSTSFPIEESNADEHTMISSVSSNQQHTMTTTTATSPTSLAADHNQTTSRGVDVYSALLPSTSVTLEPSSTLLRQFSSVSDLTPSFSPHITHTSPSTASLSSSLPPLAEKTTISGLSDLLRPAQPSQAMTVTPSLALTASLLMDTPSAGSESLLFSLQSAVLTDNPHTDINPTPTISHNDTINSPPTIDYPETISQSQQYSVDAPLHHQTLSGTFTQTTRASFLLASGVILPLMTSPPTSPTPPLGTNFYYVVPSTLAGADEVLITCFPYVGPSASTQVAQGDTAYQTPDSKILSSVTSSSLIDSDNETDSSVVFSLSSSSPFVDQRLSMVTPSMNSLFSSIPSDRVLYTESTSWRCSPVYRRDATESTILTLSTMTPNFTYVLIKATEEPNSGVTGKTKNGTSDDKEWAIPVTASLGAVALISLITITVLCLRRKPQRNDSRLPTHQRDVRDERTGRYPPHSTSSKAHHDNETIFSFRLGRGQREVENNQSRQHNGSARYISNLQHNDATDNHEMIELDNWQHTQEGKQSVFPRHDSRAYAYYVAHEHETSEYCDDGQGYAQNHQNSIYSSTAASENGFNRAKYSKNTNNLPRYPTTFKPQLENSGDRDSPPHIYTQVVKKAAIKPDHISNEFPTRSTAQYEAGNQTDRVRHEYANYQIKTRLDGSSERIFHNNREHERCLNSDSVDDASADHSDKILTSNHCHGSNLSSPQQAGMKPRISKCVSFDDAQLRANRNMLDVPTSTYNDIPNRRISTTSESAAAYLEALDGQNMQMAAAYETFDNLAEIGDSPRASTFYIGSPGENDFGKEGNFRKFDPGHEQEVSVKLTENQSDNRKDYDSGVTLSKNSPSALSKSVQDEMGPHNNGPRPEEDHIFPIMKKANEKILTERRIRKLRERSGSEYSSSKDEEESSSPESYWSKIGIDSLYNDLNRRHEEKSDINLPSSSLMPVGNNLLTPNSGISLSNIPKIVFTKAADSASEKWESDDEPSHSRTSTGSRSPRNRRIARANNPFLIEVDSTGVLDKVRRSSAPSMAGSPERPSLPIEKIIRSASGDNLLGMSSRSDNFPYRDHVTPRSWSSEFYDLIRSYPLDDPSNKERFKKMIDERYNALFSKKYPELERFGVSDKTTTPVNLSPRIVKRMRAAKLRDLPKENKDKVNAKTIAKDMDEHIAPEISDPNFSSLPRSTTNTGNSCDQPLAFRFAKESTGNYDLPGDIPSRPPRVGVNSVIELQSSTQPDIQDSISGWAPSSQEKQPRPALTRGTDGLDSDSSGVDSTKGGRKRVYAGDKGGARFEHRNAHTTSRRPLARTNWESFEDDENIPETPPSDNHFMPVRNTGDGHQSPGSRGQSGQSVVISTDAANLPLNHYEDIWSSTSPSNPARRLGASDQDHPAQLPLSAQNASEVRTSPIFLNVDAIPTESLYESISSIHSQLAPSPTNSRRSQRSFDDNFEKNIYDNIDEDNTLSQDQVERDKEMNHQNPSPGDRNESDLMTERASAPPAKPRRRPVRKPFTKNQPPLRPPSPFQFPKQDLNFEEQENGHQHRANETGNHPSLQRNAENRSENISYQPRTDRETAFEVHSPLPSEFDPQQPHDHTNPKDRLALRGQDVMNALSQARPGDDVMFVTSANNTLLEHSSLEDTSYKSNSLSENDVYFYSETTSSSSDHVTDDVSDGNDRAAMTQRRQRKIEGHNLRDDYMSHFQVSDV